MKQFSNVAQSPENIVFCTRRGVETKKLRGIGGFTSFYAFLQTVL